MPHRRIHWYFDEYESNDKQQEDSPFESDGSRQDIVRYEDEE